MAGTDSSTNPSNQDENLNTPPPRTDNVEVKSDKSVDPQLILTLVTKDGNPFNARIELDLVVRNVNDRRVTGHAETIDYIRESEVTIPINFNDTVGEWRRASGMRGAQLGYGVSIHLVYEDGREEHTWIGGYMSPTNEPPIEVEGIRNQYEMDHRPDDFALRAGEPLTEGTVLHKGEKYHCPNGIFYVGIQDDGNVVVKSIDEDFHQWDSYTSHHVPLSVEFAMVETGGNLHLYDADHNLLWMTESEGGAFFSVDGEGRPVVLGHSGEVVWTA